MNHPRLHPTLLAFRRGNSTPPASSAAADDDSLPLPHPLHAISFPNGIAKMPPPPLVVPDPSYTSIKDFLPLASISIRRRHRLVKQAAWAYLQPAAVSPVSPPVPSLCSNFSSCFRRLFAFLSRLLRRLFPFRSSR
ncbi:hypothetical protein MLD38_035561 [Melastoma candidum]|uniref:Uncharacterized protein n=1 Tax=Melastoma candidum TaxID=119954 RepID=A0ACB9LHM1_9MYRT|nr:hypothetical protein MLD38_035561 [Melastoma candidum]